MKSIILTSTLLLTVLCHGQPPPSIYIHFGVNRHELGPSARATLDSLTDTLDIADHIELYGHCDATGTDQYNLALSRRRVKAVKDYLLKNGWEPGEIRTAEGHGEREPVSENDSESGRSQNRRVEIRILRGKDSTRLIEKLADKNLKSGDQIVLPNILFIAGMHQFLDSSYPALKELLDAMKAFPNLVIRIEGHICCVAGTADGPDLETGLNNLSEARASVVRDYLVHSGISPDRVTFQGFGHSRPLYPYPEKNEQEAKENRRVEIRILKK